MCAVGWKGQHCEEPTCSDDCGAALGRGACVAGACVCSGEWRGAACDELPCPKPKAPLLKVCCAGPTPRPAPAKHPAPRRPSSPPNRHAVPIWQFLGPKIAREECSAQGRCHNGTCACEEGHGGFACELPGCPGGCSQRGECRLLRWKPPRTNSLEGMLIGNPSRLDAVCVCDAGASGEPMPHHVKPL